MQPTGTGPLEKHRMNALIGLLFCLLLGVTLKMQGIAALLWFPLGFVLALYISAQIILPLLLGLPRAIGLVSKRQMRSGIFIRLVTVPIVWFILVFGVLFLIGFFWPSAAASAQANLALNLGASLGTIAILLSPLSKKSRSDFRADFDRSYGQFTLVQRSRNTSTPQSRSRRIYTSTRFRKETVQQPLYSLVSRIRGFAT